MLSSNVVVGPNLNLVGALQHMAQVIPPFTYACMQRFQHSNSNSHMQPYPEALLLVVHVSFCYAM